MAFEFSAPHHLELADARARLHALGDYLGNKYGLTITWTGENTASVTGSYLVVTVQGTLELGEKTVTFSGKDPGMLWRGKAKDYLLGKIEKYLNPGTPVDSLPRR
ncbi:MAG TPA: polyhydroxyalkanoic acid system family protein [Polyangiaceae bacterium]|nr:polyhydroxyalkanoic acid system family protein [Polyangiaceae bacterium]